MSTTDRASSPGSPQGPSGGSELGKPARKRAYKPRLSGPRRRALVLDVALAAFAESGYELASMRTIAEAAGVTRPVLYHYFPSKQALYLALLEEQIAAMATYIAEHVTAQPDTASRIHAAAEAYLGFAEQHPQAWALLLDDSALTDPVCAHGRHQIHDTILHAGLALIAADVTGAGYTITEPRIQLGMRFVISGLNGIIQWWREHPGTSRHEIMATITELVQTLAALATPNDPHSDNDRTAHRPTTRRSDTNKLQDQSLPAT